MSGMKLLGCVAVCMSLTACVVVASSSGDKLTDEELALLDGKCGEDGWVDGRDDDKAMIVTVIEQGNDAPKVEPGCLILYRGQTVNISVSEGRTAEFRFPDYSPFAANLFRVDGDKGATLRVTASADCPIGPDRFGCKYDVAEAGNSRREILDPVILTRGGGGGE